MVFDTKIAEGRSPPIVGAGIASKRANRLNNSASLELRHAKAYSTIREHSG